MSAPPEDTSERSQAVIAELHPSEDEVLPAPTHITKLSVEVLNHVAFEITPGGGFKAANLRLASRFFSGIAQRAAWSSIEISSHRTAASLSEELKRQDEVLKIATAPKDPTPLPAARPFIKSIRYNIGRFHDAQDAAQQTSDLIILFGELMNLRRFHLHSMDNTAVVSLSPGLLPAIGGVNDLVLEGINLRGVDHILNWAPNLRYLTIIGSSNIGRLFDSPAAGSHTNLRHLSLLKGSPLHGPMAMVEGLIAFPEALVFTFDGDIVCEIGEIGGMDDYMNRHSLATRTQEFSIELTGACTLLKNNYYPSNIIEILNWAAIGPLRRLTLPIFTPIWAHHIFGALVLPNLRDLILAVEHLPARTRGKKAAVLEPGPGSFAELKLLLGMVTLPSLEVLTLRGWFDKCGASALAFKDEGISGSSHRKLPLIRELLAFLKDPFPEEAVPKTKALAIQELRLENSIGHRSACSACVFYLDATGEWDSRMMQTQTKKYDAFGAFVAALVAAEVAAALLASAA